MKKTKRLISLVLAIAMMGSFTLSGCNNQPNSASTDVSGKKGEEVKLPAGFNKTGYPISKEKVTLKMAASRRADIKEFNGLSFFKKIEDKTNVHVEWNNVQDEAWKEKLGLMFAGNDLPDAFYGNWALTDIDVVKYGEQKMLIPLEEYIDQYAPNVKKLLDSDPSYRKLITAPDGHIYALPVIDESYYKSTDALFINKKWLDQVGMKAPTTPDELYEVLKAFKGKDLNKNGKQDEIPMSFRYVENAKSIWSLFGSFGRLDTREHTVMDGDKVVFTADKPEFKEAIKYFNKLFSEGLIDKESFTQDSKIMNSKLLSNPPIVGVATAWSRTAFTKDPDPNKCEYVAIPPLKGKEGKQIWNAMPFGVRGKGAFAITANCKNPEIAIRWADEMYDSKTSYQSNVGLIGELLKENSDGKIEALKLDKPTTQKYKANVPGASCISAISKDFAAKIVPSVAMVEKQKVEDLYKPFFPKNIYPLVFFTSEENEKISTLNTDIIQYVDQTVATWMLKGGVDKEWDEYVKKLNSMGVADFVKIKQDAYDRYKAEK